MSKLKSLNRNRHNCDSTSPSLKAHPRTKSIQVGWEGGRPGGLSRQACTGWEASRSVLVQGVILVPKTQLNTINFYLIVVEIFV